MRALLIIFCLSMSISLSGCVDSPYLSANRFLTPESRGKALSGDVYAGISQVGWLRTADADANGAPIAVSPQLETAATIQVGGELGLAKMVDMYLSHPGGAAAQAGVKAQIWGHDASTAQSGNVSVAFAAGIPFGAERGGIRTLDKEVDYSGWSAVALFGYRYDESALLYANPFWNHLRTKIRVSNSHGNEIHPDGSGDSLGVTLGGRFERPSRNTFCGAELSLERTTWTREAPTSANDQAVQVLAGAIAGWLW